MCWSELNAVRQPPSGPTGCTSPESADTAVSLTLKDARTWGMRGPRWGWRAARSGQGRFRKGTRGSRPTPLPPDRHHRGAWRHLVRRKRAAAIHLAVRRILEAVVEVQRGAAFRERVVTRSPEIQQDHRAENERDRYVSGVVHASGRRFRSLTAAIIAPASRYDSARVVAASRIEARRGGLVVGITTG